MPFVLIGGIAVLVRLGRFHRATADVDTLATDGLRDATLALLGPARAEASARNSVVIDGVTVDFVPLDERPLTSGAALERAWSQGRSFAFTTATEATVTVIDSDDAVVASSVLQTASAGSLIYLKMISIMRRRPDRAHKKITDMHDLIRLVGAHPLAQLRDELVGAPEQKWLTEALTKNFRSDARYTILRTALGNPDAAALVPDDLERVAELADLLKRAS